VTTSVPRDLDELFYSIRGECKGTPNEVDAFVSIAYENLQG
jgi:hypothetical protein